MGMQPAPGQVPVGQPLPAGAVPAAVPAGAMPAAMPGQATAAAAEGNVLDQAASGLGVGDFRGLYGGSFTGLEPISFERRLSNIATRGIAMGPGQSLRSLYEHRVPFYLRHADVLIDAQNQTLEETVSAVVHAWRSLKTN